MSHHELTPKGKSEQAQIMSVAEAEKNFKGRWILMQVTEYDENGNPLAGEIIYTSRSRGKVSKTLAKQPPRHEQWFDAGPYYTFHAPPRGNSLKGRIVRKIIAI